MNIGYDNGVLVAIIVALSEFCKKVGVNPKFIPIINLLLGVVGGIIYLNPADLKIGILEGLIMGLTAGGFYSSIKNVGEGINVK